ncbi:MAG TPA: multiheme c-type cytochrome [Nannocystaceae bacterium]|nr:multiheme c-type cytochrome [Nannocystaceae bacterium]
MPRRQSGALLASGFVGLFVIVLAGATCGDNGTSKPPQDDGTRTPAVAERAQFDLFVFGRVRGTIAPCGCTTEPLGGLQYSFGMMQKDAEPGAWLAVEPRSFLYPDPKDPEAPADAAGWEQAERKATLLQTRFAKLGDRLVSGVGPLDASSPKGAAALAAHPLPRVAANVTAKPGVELAAHRVSRLKSGGLEWKVGVTTAIDPALAGTDALGTVGPAAEAVRREIAAMKAAGAGTTVVLAQGDRKFAEELAKDVDGIDIVVVGIVEGIERQRLGTPPTHLGGKTWVVEPGEQMQTVTRLRLSVETKAGAVPAAADWTIVPAKAQLEAELARIDERLKKFEADPSADPAFLERLRAERSDVTAKLSGTSEGAAVAVFEQVKVTCKLPADDEAKQMLAAYDQAIAAANKARFTGVKPPPPKKGKAGYVGVAACADCHEEAVEFWKTTVHAGAWETLVEDNKDLDLSCVSCHVTGWRKPGGSELVEHEGLQDVQCEVCHGPGSLHVEDGGDDLKHITLKTTSSLCSGECHTPEHSDTFEYDAYMRDILGKGHGENARKALGDGPTGAQLRKAGLEKAGGPCKKT